MAFCLAFDTKKYQKTLKMLILTAMLESISVPMIDFDFWARFRFLYQILVSGIGFNFRPNFFVNPTIYLGFLRYRVLFKSSTWFIAAITNKRISSNILHQHELRFVRSVLLLQVKYAVGTSSGLLALNFMCTLNFPLLRQ